MSSAFLPVETEISALPEEWDRGMAFELVAERFLRRDPVGDFVRLWRWNEWPERFRYSLRGRDDGIDLVGEERDGSFVGI